MENNFLEQLQEQAPKITRKKWYKNLKIIIPLIIIIFVGGVYADKNPSNGKIAGETINNNIKEVKTIILDSEVQNADEIKTSGIVKADTKVDVVSLTKGTIRNIFFSTGEETAVNQILVDLYDSGLLTNLNNAQIGYNNSRQSLDSVKITTEQNIKQAEIGVKNAGENIKSAEIALKSAQDNLSNVEILQTKSTKDLKNNAVVSFYSYLNTANNTIDQVNYLIKAEGNSQIAGIARTLGVKDVSTLDHAKDSYQIAKRSYDNLSEKNVNTVNILSLTKEIVSLLDEVNMLVNNAIIVLNNTISSSEFNDSALMTQRSSFTNVSSVIVSSQNSTNMTLQSLQNISITNKRELDALKNNVTQAKNQIILATTARDNAIASLNNAKQGKEQQLISAQTGVDGAQGQLDVVQTQVGNLTIKAPISGIITKKYVELGAEVSPGQKVAEISQTNLVKIEVNLTSEDVYRIEIGQSAMINGMFEGIISHIDPSADAISKKVKIEIAFDNRNNDLITETFVDITIPIAGEKSSKFQDGTFFIPIRSVTMTQTNTYVFIVVDNKAIKKEITVGETEGDKIKVIGGLENGDILIIDGNRSLEGDEDIIIIQ